MCMGLLCEEDGVGGGGSGGGGEGGREGGREGVGGGREGVGGGREGEKTDIYINVIDPNTTCFHTPALLCKLAK